MLNVGWGRKACSLWLGNRVKAGDAEWGEHMEKDYCLEEKEMQY